MEYVISEIETVAKGLVRHLPLPGAVVALHGNLGAGKTTLTQAILQALGSEDIAQSPTFSIINMYALKNGEWVAHMDWYRLNDEEEAIMAGVPDALHQHYLCLVEWPEKFPDLLPEATIHLYLETIDQSTRKLIGLPTQLAVGTTK